MRRLLLVLFALSQTVVQGSDLIDVIPLTDQILMLHFDDGYIDHHGYREGDDQDITFNFPLNTENAQNPLFYKIYSNEDLNFTSGVNPVEVGRKSKGTDFSRKCLWDGSVCQNDYIQEHWLYLFLPKEFKKDTRYFVQLSGLADNFDEVPFIFDEAKHRSGAIHINQLGYLPNAEKYGYVSHWMGDKGSLSLDSYQGNPFYILDMASGETVFNGALEFRAAADNKDTQHTDESPNGNFAAAEVFQCDFSSFNTPGNYKLVVEGIGSSFPFDISDDIYREAFYYVTRGVHYQRAGFDHTTTGEIWDWKIDHKPDVTPGFDRLFYSSYRYMNSPGENGPKEQVLSAINHDFDINQSWGWYHDAGDWDGYPSHFVVPAYLLTIFELNPGKFTDGELNIAESGNGLPDIVDEGMWLLNFWRRSKGPSGGIAGARVSADLDDTGKGDGRPSWEDPREAWIVYGEEPAMSFRYAALAAQLAWIYKLMDSNGVLGSEVSAPDSVQAWQVEAVNAYQWAVDHTQNGDEQLDLGRYGAGNLADIRAHAAAALYKLTGNETYQDQFMADEKQSDEYNGGEFSDQKWAIWTYVTIPDTTAALNQNLKTTLIERSLQFADDYNLDGYNMRGWRQAGNEYFPILIGQATTPMVIESVMAYHLSGEKKYFNAITHTADYMLGGNPLNMTWITGLGERNPRQVLNLDSWYDQIEPMVAGIVPYGPHRGEGNGYNGPWDVDFAQDRVYPVIENYPAHERWFENRYCPIVAEYTVHQNLALAAAVYGFLSNQAGNAYQANQRPTITLQLPSVSFTQTDSLKLNVYVSDDLGIERVVYYQNNRFIAAIDSGDFQYKWPLKKAGTYAVKAIAYDLKGRYQSSDIQIIKVNKISNPPSIVWNTPAESYLATVGNPLKISVEVSDDGAVEKVEYYNYNDLLGESTSEPHAISFTPSKSGILNLRVKAIDNTGLETTISRFVEANEPTDLESIGTVDTIYPNAANHWINLPIKYERANYRIYNNRGQIVQKGKVKNQVIAIEKLNAGSYFIIINRNEGAIKYRFIKK